MIFMAASALAQQMPAIPVDPQVRIGKLDNGMTYYIRHNEWPEQRADFYIAQKVGSMQEEESQRGLAHFLEHMCFNGTTHFPGDGLKSYLETIGVKFGENLNAYTSFDETVYNINNVPVISNPASLDSCLLILHDWSHDLLLEGKEIDKERGVINEEWRMRSSAQQRLYEKLFPALYEGSKYANRMPIGTMDIVMNFPYDAIRSYYKKWYRPDLQGIVVVGDVDVDKVEQKIKTMFADIKPVENAAERVYFPVEKNKEPIFAVGKDKEQPRSMAYLMWKQDVTPDAEKGNLGYLLTQYVQNAIATMFDGRVSEIIMKDNPPFIAGGMGYGDYIVSKTMDNFLAMALFKDNGHKDAIKAIYREVLRAYRHGFTETEYIRFKEEFKSSLDNQYEKRNKVSNTSFCEEYYRHFLDNEPIPGIEWEHQVYPTLMDQIPLQVINQAFQSDSLDQNLAIMMMLPDKEGIVEPTKDEILSILKEVEAEEIEAYKEEVSNEPLVDVAALKGSKIKKQAAGPWDSQVITLANGINIYVKKTDYQPNNISFDAESWGGMSLYKKDFNDLLNISFAGKIGLGGWGQFSATDLQKKLAGKQASCSPTIGVRSEGLSGRCVTKDLETLLQLIYLNFTAPRRDDAAFSSTIQRTKSQLQNAELQPTSALQDSIVSTLYNNNDYARKAKAKDYDNISYDEAMKYYKERFANAADFTFFFTGDIDIEAAKPLFEQYLGSLPVTNKKEKYNQIDLKITDKNVTNVFQKKQETPMAYCVFAYKAMMDHNLKNEIQLSMLDQIMNILFTETVREDEGGAYSVSVASNVSDYPEKFGLIQIVLPTAPEKRVKMTEVINNGIDKLVSEGPKAEVLEKVREYMLRSYDENVKTNGFWLNGIVTKVTENKDMITGYTDIVKAVTANDMKALAKKVLKDGNRIEVTMTDDTKK